MEVLSSCVDQERIPLTYKKSNILEYDANTSESIGITPKEQCPFDLAFLVGRDIYHGHQRIFAELSHKFSTFLNREPNGLLEIVTDGIIEIRRTPNSSIPMTISIDAPIDIFECIFNFCYTRRLAIPAPMVPSLCIVARKLGISVLEEPCVEYLANNLGINSIGDLCNLIHFGLLLESPTPLPPDASVTPLELQLTQSTFSYVKSNADLVVTSLTGQLRARLIVNLQLNCPTEEIHSSLFDPHRCQPTARLIFGLLLWVHNRVISGQRLTRAGGEENVQSDDEESDSVGGDGNGGGVGSLKNGFRVAEKSVPHLPLEVRLKNLGGIVYHRADKTVGDAEKRWRSKESLSEHDSSESEVSKPVTTDIRISVHLHEIVKLLDVESPSNSVSVSPLSPVDHGTGSSSSTTTNNNPYFESDLRVYPAMGSRSESETCLLARTTLGVGATSIWLGKLTGYLVGLSVKLCRPRSISTHTSNSSILSDNRSFFSRPYLSSRESLNGLCSSPDDNSSPTVSLRLPSSDEDCEHTMTSNIDITDRSSYGSLNGLGCGRSFKHYFNIRYPMLESRAGMGAGSLTMCSGDADDRHYIVVPGGFTRKGCLDSVELYDITSTADLVCPIWGPRLRRPRGRLAVAHVRGTELGSPAMLYACGGSTGSLDLNTVERLSSDVLASWLATTTRDIQSSVNEIPPTRTNNRSSPWQTVPNMKQVRCSPSSTNLCQLQTGSIISNPIGSILVAGGVSNAMDLSSVELYVPERNEWFFLPSMSTGRREAACSVLPSKNLVLVAGGASTTSYPKSGALIEALDPRCPSWIQLPSPNGPVGQGTLRGACLIRDPQNEDGIMLLGGYNGQDALNSTWLFDSSSWQWLPGPPMLVPRSNFSSVVSDSSVWVFGGFNVCASHTGFIDSVEAISFS